MSRFLCDSLIFAVLVCTIILDRDSWTRHPTGQIHAMSGYWVDGTSHPSNRDVEPYIVSISAVRLAAGKLLLGKCWLWLWPWITPQTYRQNTQIHGGIFWKAWEKWAVCNDDPRKGFLRFTLEDTGEDFFRILHIHTHYSTTEMKW